MAALNSLMSLAALVLKRLAWHNLIHPTHPFHEPCPKNRQVLECASPLALSKGFGVIGNVESARGLAHSKTLTRRRTPETGSLSQRMSKRNGGFP